MTADPPIGLDILILDILLGHKPALPVAMTMIYKAMTLAHGSPPDVITICRMTQWFAGMLDDVPATFITWGFDSRELVIDEIPEESVIATVRHFHLLENERTKT